MGELSDTTKSRLRMLKDMGLVFDGEQFTYKDINFHHTNITCMTQEEFNEAYCGAIRRMLDIHEEEIVDAMTYKEMFRLWRFAPSGNKYFVNDHIGRYFSNSMREKRSRITNEEYTRISKEIGW